MTQASISSPVASADPAKPTAQVEHPGPRIASGVLRPEPHVACAQCGLAVREGDLFCCYGCEIAAQIAKEGAEEHGHTKAAMLFSLLLSMTVMMLSLFLFSEDVYGANPAGGMGWLAEGYRWASFVLSAPVLVLLGVPLGRRAISGVSRGHLGMDLLIAAGAYAAFGLSVYALFAGKRGVYFDSATSALLLATLGRYLEARGRANAARMLGPLLGRASELVLVANADDAARFEPRSPALIVRGDLLRIQAEQMLPVDAVLTSGAVDVNLSVLTGESMPVTRHAGDELPAGAVPVSGAITCRALRPAAASTLERLAALSRSLASNRGELQRWADRFARVLTPLVFIAAFATLFLHASTENIDRGVVAALAVVLAACPCTYGAATPLVFWLAARKALEHGVLVRSAETLESLAHVRAVAFDKTGTLTPRALSVSRVEIKNGFDRRDILSIVRTLEAGSRHPVGAALAEIGAREGGEGLQISDLRHVPGRGVQGKDEAGRALRLGAPAWIAEEIGGAQTKTDARVALAIEGDIAALFFVAESVRAEAPAAIGSLREAGIGAWMLTGDGEAGAQHVADQLKIDATANLAAADKVAAMQAAGANVAMVGDGLNDAPALAGAHVGFAVEGSTDLARSMAAVVLLSPDLRLVPWTLRLARRAVQLAKRNLIASTIYNLLFLGLAMAGALKPVWAGLSMAASSIFLLASASRISGFSSPSSATDEQQAARDADAPRAAEERPR